LQSAKAMPRVVPYRREIHSLAFFSDLPEVKSQFDKGQIRTGFRNR